MKKLFTLFFSLTLCSISLYAGLTTSIVDVWGEDFNSIQGNLNNSKLTFTNTASPTGPMIFGGSALAIRAMGPTGNAYCRADFNYDETDQPIETTIQDNWTLTFSYVPNSNWAKQIAIVGKNFTSGGLASSNVYLSLERKANVASSNIFDIKLGNQTVATDIEIPKKDFLFTLKYTANESGNGTGTLYLLIEYKDNLAKLCEATITDADVSTWGALGGMYVFENTAGMTITQIDDFLLTKEVTVDDTPCSTPEFSVTGANGLARQITLTCETEGAKIYYANEPLDPGEEGWTEYTGPVETEESVIFYYAHSTVNGTNSEVVGHDTYAGSLMRARAPYVNKESYDSRGFAVTLTPNYDYMEYYIPADYELTYKINSGTETIYTEGDTIFVPENSSLTVSARATGCTSGSSTIQMANRPTGLSELWSQDFLSLADGSDNSRHAIILDGNVAYNVETKPFYNIKQYRNGSQNVNINIDSRLALTTDSCFYLTTKNSEWGGLLGYKHVSEEEYEDDYETLAYYDGLGISGLSAGQYIFVNSKGGMTTAISGADMLAEASTLSDQIFVATGNTMMLDIPFGVSVKDITVRANFEAVTTNAYGYATYVCKNPIDIFETQQKYPEDELTASVVTNEVRSGTFTTEAFDELVANTPFILHGKPNTTYELVIGYATTPRWSKNLLTYSTTNFNPATWENPVYVVNAEGNIVKADKSSVIPAGTPFITSELPEAEYIEVTLNQNGYLAMVTPKPIDFAEDDITAKIASFETYLNGITLADITAAPANTPVLLKGTPNKTYFLQVGQCETLSGNLLRGSLTESFNPKDTANMVMTFNDSGVLVEVNKNTTTTLPAGTVYYISKYCGFEQITTDSYGTVAFVANKNLHFSEIGLKPYIATGETETDIVLANVSEVPAGNAVIAIGKPDTTYNVPVHNSANLGQENKFQSRTTAFNVDDEDNYVWAWSPEQGKMYRTEEGTVIPANQPFFISQYERKPFLGYERIRTNDIGIATYVCENALDFSHTGLQAYVATEERKNGVFTFVNVDRIKAGEAFFVKSKEPNKEFDIPIVNYTGTITNLFEGSRDTAFFVGSQDKTIYIISAETGNIVRAARSLEIPAGKAWLPSKFVGIEFVQTNAQGYALYKCQRPLDFTELKDDEEAFIILGDKFGEPIYERVDAVTAGTAFLFHGAPDSIYSIPIGSLENGKRSQLRTSSVDEPVSNYDSDVIGLSPRTGLFEKLEATDIIPAGVPYLVTNFRGFEQITTNSNGTATYITKKPLNFSEIELKAYIVTDETVDAIFSLDRTYDIPSNTPILVKGEKDSTYNVPVGTYDKDISDNNMLKGRHDVGFDVKTVDTYVYALSGKTGELTKVSSTMVIPAGKAYIISKYKGYEKVTLNSTGMATYICQKPLDLRNRLGEIDDLAAYIVTGDNGDPTNVRIMTKRVFEVPAGTPFILKGIANSTYVIPVGDCDYETWSLDNDNKLGGSPDEPFVVASAAPYNVYIVSAKTGEFTKASATLTIPAGKVYYISQIMNSSAQAKSITILYDDEEAEYTGIQTTTTEETSRKGKRFVNLAGQQVGEDYKGIVIDENGNKYDRK